MPLIECPDCGHRLSDLAPACVQCGRPMTPMSPPSAPQIDRATSGAGQVARAPEDMLLDRIEAAFADERWGFAVSLLGESLDVQRLNDAQLERLVSLLYDAVVPESGGGADIDQLNHFAYALRYELRDWAPPFYRSLAWGLRMLVGDASVLSLMGREEEAVARRREVVELARGSNNDSVRARLVDALTSLSFHHTDVFDDLLAVHPVTVGRDRDSVADAIGRVVKQECNGRLQLQVSVGSAPLETLETAIAHCEAALVSLNKWPSERSARVVASVHGLKDAAESSLRTGARMASRTPEQRA
jgi:hypothetical protein